MRLQEVYQKNIVPALMQELKETNRLAVPRFKKVVLHVGLGPALKDAKFLETVESTLKRISGLAPVKTRAKKSISNFKIREGMVIGTMVTLRGARMYDFLDRLVHVALPRVRDFRGLSPKIVDAQGNLTIGFREHLVFPEIRSDEVERLHGLEVIVQTSAGTHDRGMALFRAVGFPFGEENERENPNTKRKRKK